MIKKLDSDALAKIKGAFEEKAEMNVVYVMYIFLHVMDRHCKVDGKDPKYTEEENEKFRDALLSILFYLYDMMVGNHIPDGVNTHGMVPDFMAGEFDDVKGTFEGISETITDDWEEVNEGVIKPEWLKDELYVAASAMFALVALETKKEEVIRWFEQDEPMNKRYVSTTDADMNISAVNFLALEKNKDEDDEEQEKPKQKVELTDEQSEWAEGVANGLIETVKSIIEEITPNDKKLREYVEAHGKDAYGIACVGIMSITLLTKSNIKKMLKHNKMTEVADRAFEGCRMTMFGDAIRRIIQSDDDVRQAKKIFRIGFKIGYQLQKQGAIPEGFNPNDYEEIDKRTKR